jgi:AcrR family transcriptional regulator
MSAPLHPNPHGPTAERLLAVAARLFRVHGYAATSTRELSRGLGIGSATLYHHVGKKEDLLFAICLDALERLDQATREALDQQTDPLERVRRLLRAHLITALQDRDKHATMLIDLPNLSPERRADVLRRRAVYQRLVRNTIAEAQAAGVVRSDLPARYIARGLFNLLNWSIFWWRPDGELTPNALAELLTTVFLEGAGRQLSQPHAQQHLGRARLTG